MSCAIKTLSSVGDINGRQVTSLIDDEFQLTGPLGWLSSLAQSQGKASRNLSCEQINMGECKNNNNKVVDLGFEGFLLDEELADANPFLAKHQGTSFSASASSNFILRGWLLVAEWKWE